MIKGLKIIFGISLILFGLNGFFKFIPLPEKEGFAALFLQTLQQAGYLMPTIACIQIFTGITLLLNRATFLGLLVLLPISYNMAFFHLLHDPQGLIPALLIFIFNLLLMKNDLLIFFKGAIHEN